MVPDSTTDRLLPALVEIVGSDNVLRPAPAQYLTDETGRGLRGDASAVVLPGTADQAAAVVARCYDAGAAITPRGGGSGVAGGAVPAGGVVVACDRLDRIRNFDPLLWRIHAEAGVTTARLHRTARESGLMFPPDPGAAEQSQTGGNLATNAGGPHALRYGVTRRWVTGVEAVIAPGRLITVGGATRKDTAGYDLAGLLVGSEGTLGLITAAWLRLVPAPEAVHLVAACYPTSADACAAIERVLGSGTEASALELLDEPAARLGGGGFPGGPLAGCLLLAEADGSTVEAAARRDALLDALATGALSVAQPDDPAAVWRWRDGVSSRLSAVRGGKLSEDIAVPLDRLSEALAEVPRIGERHGLTGLSFGHAGDGNLHATFLLDPADDGERAAADAARDELFALAIELGGTISGEHGLGLVKSGRLQDQWGPAALDAHAAIKRALDPRGLFNPGKKLPTR